MTSKEQIQQDKEIIESLGGPPKVAEILGFDKAGGVQRVHNWTKRGIPPKQKVERPDLFMRNVVPSEGAAAVAVTAS